MIGALKWLAARPSDAQIRTGNIVFGLILILSTYYNFFYLSKTLDTNYFWVELPNMGMIVPIILMVLGAIPLLMGVSHLCILKSKYMRILQIVIGVLLMYFSGKITESPTLDIDTLFLLLSFIPLFVGITGKAITKKCLRYGEKVQKIRV